MTTDQATLRTYLGKLEAARMEMMTSKTTVTITDAGRSITYGRVKLSELNAEIMRVKSLLGLSRRRAIGVSFGR